MKIAFYIVGIADFQDMMPVIIEAGLRKHQVRVYIFDCLFKKRQLYYYRKEDLVDFVDKTLEANSVDHVDVSFYGQDQKSDFESEIDDFSPDYVILQNAKHRYPVWYPKSGNAKVVHFAWHMDSAQALVRGNYDVHLNIIKREKDEVYYGKNIPDHLQLTEDEKEKVPKVDTRHFGNFRLDHLNYNSYFKTLDVSGIGDKKVCFISEAHLKSGKDNFKEIPRFVDELISYLHEKGYYIFWKKREKGFPKERWNSPLDFCKNSPDFIVDKDMNFPSSIVYLPYIADASFVINTSSAYWDIKKINKNTAMLQTKDPGPREEKYIKLVYEDADPNADFDLLNMQNEDRFSILEAWLAKDKSINESYIREQRPSKNLLDHLEIEHNER